MFTSELKHGNVKKIVLDPDGGVHVITPIFPLNKVTNHKELAKKWGVSGFVSKVVGNLKRAIGKADLTLMKTLDNHFAHPTKEGANQFENYTFQSQYSLGKLEHVFDNPDSDNVIWGSYDVTEPIAKPVILEYMDSYNRGLVPLYTSSQIVNSASENPYAIENFDLMHTTLTDDPSFGKELTKVGAVCQGNTQACVMQIRTASNVAEDANVLIIGKDVQIHHKTCPFCVKDELTRLFKQNSFLKLNKASNLQMSAQEEQKPQEEQKIVNPDADQNKNSSAFDPVAMSKEIEARVKAEFDKQKVVNAEEEKKPEEPVVEAPKDEKKEDVKEVSFKDSPEYKAMAAKMEKLSKQLDDNKVDKERLKTLESEQNFNKIGQTLAKYESNFINPDTGKADAKAFDKAFEFLRNLNWSVEDIETHLAILSPFGHLSRRQIEEQQTPIQRAASMNRGVPAYGSAFGKEEIHEASNKKTSSGLSLLDSMLQENQI